MSFQSLISGSECAAPANPLNQVLKHTEGDRSLQQDRIAGPSTSRLHQLPGTSGMAPANEQDLALARQFFDPHAHSQGLMPAFPGHHPQDLAHMGEMPARPGMNEAWALEQQQHQFRQMDDSAKTAGWANEFSHAGPANTSAAHIHDHVQARPDFQGQSSFMSPMYGNSMRMGMYGMASPMPYGGIQAPAADIGKGKAREADFEAAFAKVLESLSLEDSKPAQTSRIEEVDEAGNALSKDLNEALEQVSNAENPSEADLSKWEAEFSQLMNSQRDELEDIGSNMQNAWESGIGNYASNPIEKPIQFDDQGIPQLGDYIFETSNKYLDPSTSSRSLLNEAKALLEQNGSLSEAGLMLEAAIQKGELGEGGYETWILLGETRNMDEREEAGMRALMYGVRIAEENGAAGAGMLSLAISFTNESYDRASHSTLLKWFRARYPEATVPQETIEAMATNSAWDTHGRVTDLFLNMARTQHGQDKVDAELQVALGVLFYTNGEYDRAQDCFLAALNFRPKDYLLWNRYGSSLSNGNKPEEALGAYREALQLRPTYTRAIYNVGVACLNIGADKEAAEHFLSALSLQESTNGDTSDQLWYTLRRTLLSMNRSDLAELSKPEAKTRLDVFRREGFEF
ncbi:peroxisome targeting signal receptor [Panaeolus papilionaceus]|nr:peroxisome targeting signal receptor [Panaeolus papilionaceus]